MPQQRRRFSAELREEAVKMVLDPARPIAQAARELGLNEGTLGSWVNAWRKGRTDDEAALTVSERARLRELEREIRGLRTQNDFLKEGAPRAREAA
ncbi:MAG: transposase [Egibacteraceae bacterium]